MTTQQDMADEFDNDLDLDALRALPREKPPNCPVCSLQAFVAVLKDGQAVLDVAGVLGLDPKLRHDVLVEAGVLAKDHAQIKTLREAWSEALRAAQQRK